MSRHEELGFDSEEEMEAFEAEQDEHAEEIRNIVLDYMEENEVPEATAIYTLLQLALSLEMSGYVAGTEKPSVQGLKMELDRFSSDFSDLVREAKKDAQDFIDSYRKAAEEGQDD